MKKTGKTCAAILAAAFVLALFFACKPGAGGKAPGKDQGQKVALDLKDYKLDTSAFRTGAHRQYLADPMKFDPMPDQGVSEQKTAVVGSRVCRFYAGASLSSASGLASLGEGIEVPFGTILPVLGDKVSDASDAEHGGMFNFQDNWNWFYPTRFQGKDGLVFGSDLYGLYDKPEENRITARLYQTGGRYEAFYPVLGYTPLDAAVSSRLESDRVAFQGVRPGEYYLSMSSPDDMIALYDQERPGYQDDDKRRQTPLFVTTDLMAHAQHLMFDRLLQYLEETYFVPRLKDLNKAFIEGLEAQQGGGAAVEDGRTLAIKYFQVAEALLELADIQWDGKDEYGASTVVYSEKDKEAVLQSYPADVRAEIALIDAAGGFQESRVLGEEGSAYKEDYSQYKPRGHYTKNGILSAYFRAMMWYGRIGFLMDGGRMSRAAIIVNDMVSKDDRLLASWSALFDPITALIGRSDDISFKDFLPFWKDKGAGKADLAAWLSDSGKLQAFCDAASEGLRPPLIAGSSIYKGTGVDGGGKALVGWRLFGQRFTWDSYVHQKVSPPRLMSRDMVRGLDVMKAFGSQTADLLLQKSDYPSMEGLKTCLDGIEGEFAAKGSDFWTETYYNNVLYEVKTQAQFEPGAGFYFTETPAWGIKAMLASHGTWAELRHDTILYVKQVYAERAGDGDFNPTFRTEKVPEPVHYLEPDVPFWQGAVMSVQGLVVTLDRFGLMDDESAQALGRLQEICVKAVEVATAEAADKALSREDIDWIPTIPAELARIVLIHQDGGESADEEQLKMAVIADVYTNAELGQVLETAVGIPYRMYVALNDGQGGKRIAVGYDFSYYEFGHPMGDRMTDEQWKAIVYADDAQMDDYLPFWANGMVLEPEPKRR